MSKGEILLTCPLRGTTYLPTEGREVLLNLDPGFQLVLERDPTNKWDPSAIAVMAYGRRVGWVARAQAREVAPLMDAGWRFTAVLASRVAGEYTLTLKGEYDAPEERKLEEDDLRKHPDGDASRQTTEAGDRDRDEPSP